MALLKLNVGFSLGPNARSLTALQDLPLRALVLGLKALAVFIEVFHGSAPTATHLYFRFRLTQLAQKVEISQASGKGDGAVVAHDAKNLLRNGLVLAVSKVAVSTAKELGLPTTDLDAKQEEIDHESVEVDHDGMYGYHQLVSMVFGSGRRLEALGLPMFGRRGLQLLYREEMRVRDLAGDRHFVAANNLASMLKESGEYKEAIEVNKETCERFRGWYPEGHVATVAALSNMAMAYELGLGNPKEAGKCLEEAAAMCPTLPACRIVALAYYNYASWLGLRKRYEEADKVFEQALKVERAVLPRGDHDLCKCLAGHAVNLGRLDRHAEAIPLLEEVIPHIRHAGDELSFVHSTINEFRAVLAARPALRKPRKPPPETAPAASRPPAPALSQAERDRLERELTGDDTDTTKGKKGKKK